MANKDKFADEIMSDDELDNVTGGSAEETEDDSRFLNSLNGSCDRYGAARVVFQLISIPKEIKKAWATVGIEAELYLSSDNKYYLDDKQITQEEARQHAMKVTGHYMSESEWNW